MKKISIITVCYNSEKTIENTIRSVIRQKTDEIEYIIVDGKSSDGTMNIINKYKDNIDLVISEKDKGISDAFNKGIKYCTGEIIGIINSDDAYLPDTFNRVIDIMDESIDVLFGNGIRLYKDGSFKLYNANPEISELRRGMSMVHPATFVRKSAYDKYGVFDEIYKCTMDHELFLRMLDRGAVFKYTNEYFAIYRMDGESDKKYLNRTIKEEFDILEMYNHSKLIARRCCLKAFLVYCIVKTLEKMHIIFKRMDEKTVLEKINKESL